ncbi:T9SS type A sorting domain-containing protein [Flavobacterium sp.]|uniref:T9SS type A sorting domain-containing protein n=1 Tax=Flavobacterium sp. TaxID=239 RepID=UPI002489EC36|nr:T9SS type A sorting domain-containing protein [Flavobacterium sp.]MDI1315682.1 T9SS type A sorting domain-containing protein [Flavobacterium sp.]
MIADLLAYSTVIESAKITNNYEFTDATRLQLVNLNIGAPVGTSNNIIVTNDAGLNTIFQNFNVFYYVQSYPSSNVNSTLRYYTTVCDCDKNLLNAALLNYASVIQTIESVNGGVMLSNPQFDKPKAVISPNPFPRNFDIETEQTIVNYAIIDINGKTISNTTSKAELDYQSSKLSAGMYILNLDFENGQKANYKLMKK